MILAEDQHLACGSFERPRDTVDLEIDEQSSARLGRVAGLGFGVGL